MQTDVLGHQKKETTKTGTRCDDKNCARGDSRNYVTLKSPILYEFRALFRKVTKPNHNGFCRLVGRYPTIQSPKRLDGKPPKTADQAWVFQGHFKGDISGDISMSPVTSHLRTEVHPPEPRPSPDRCAAARCAAERCQVELGRNPGLSGARCSVTRSFFHYHIPNASRSSNKLGGPIPTCPGWYTSFHVGIPPNTSKRMKTV